MKNGKSIAMAFGAGLLMSAFAACTNEPGTNSRSNLDSDQIEQDQTMPADGSSAADTFNTPTDTFGDTSMR